MTSTKSTRPFSRRAAVAWGRLRTLPWRDRWSEDEWREPFQLTVAATIYLGNALSSAPESEWHVKLRRRPPELPVYQPQPPQFGRRSRFRLEFARMHLASGSVRVVSAALLHRSFRSCRRRALVPYVPAVMKLGCCGTTTGLSLELALVLLAAHRDEFGHGELGTDKRDEWHAEREALIDKTYGCRILQAQLVIIDWLTEELRETDLWQR